MQFQLSLDAPEEVSEEEWNQVLWAYGGGMTLFEKGKNLFPIEYRESMNIEDTKLFQEGWMSPLSRQTQESRIHELTRHPRTAVGGGQAADRRIRLRQHDNPLGCKRLWRWRRHSL